jgi:hypothetical protein
VFLGVLCFLVQPVSNSRRANLGFAFSLVGALLIFLRGLVRMIRGDVITFIGSDEFKMRFLAGIAYNVLGGIAIIFAITIIFGAILIFNNMEVAGGTIVIIFSLLSILVGSGWLIGLILGLIGGILAILKK